MGVGVERAVLRPDVRCRTLGERDHAVGRLGQRLRIETPVVDRRYDVVVEFVATERHHQIESCGHRADPVDDGSPVADDHTVEFPCVTQDSGEQLMTLARVDAVDAVVRAHHCPWTRRTYDVSERAEIQFVQRAFVDCRADPHAIGFLIVGGEVLQRRPDVDALDSSHPCLPECAGQHRILRVVLEVAAAERGALEVHAGTEHDRHLPGERFGTDGLADTRCEFGVPCLGQSDRRREARCGNALRQTQGIGGALLLAESVGAVGHRDRRHSTF